MFPQHNEVVAGLLRAGGLVGRDELDVLQKEHRATGQPISDLAVKRGLISRPELLAQIARSLGAPFAAEVPASLAPATLELVSAHHAQAYGVVPVGGDGETIDVIAVDPFDSRIADDLSFALSRQVRVLVADPHEVSVLLKQHYGTGETNLEQLIVECASDGAPSAAEGELTLDELESLATRAPVVRFVDRVLDQAVRDKASDIHFEPFEREFKIRYRVDGALYEISPPPKSLALPITSRIKVLANLNIAERRVPQDGRIRTEISGRFVDLRVSTLPTQFGESVVLRVLDQSAVHLDLAQLGMSAEVLKGVREVVHRPNGIFIVTGPTGSGKTTTLYSGLRAINSVGVKVITAEDPVEYEIEGVMQVPVNPGIGFTFSSALRSFLRQDPDVIMVGEIRDLETAQIAIQASLTGHLVLTTLHTNDAAGAIARLSDMGIEPFLIANTVEAVLAQRLLRCVCMRCRIVSPPSEEMLERAGISGGDLQGADIFRGVGCSDCAQTGYRGRLGIFEWLPMTELLRERVIARAPTLDLRDEAIRQGMRTLRQGALDALRAGQTSFDELVRYT